MIGTLQRLDWAFDGLVFTRYVHPSTPGCYHGPGCADRVRCCVQERGRRSGATEPTVAGGG